MRRLGRRVEVAAGLALALALTGCGSAASDGGTSSSTATTATTATTASAGTSAAPGTTAVASPTAGVAPATLQARCGEDRTLQPPLPTPFTFTTADGVTLLGAEFGTGPRGVVALHELSAQGLCGWSSYAQYLATKGLHVLVFDHRCVGLSTCPTTPAGQRDLLSDITAARAELVKRGATSTALIGASQGGGEAIAAAGTQAGWSRVAVLSGALFTLDFGGGVTAAAAMPKVSVPTVFYVAGGDPDSPLALDRALVATARPGVVGFHELPPGGHGWTLLQAFAGAEFAATAAEVAAFLLA